MTIVRARRRVLAAASLLVVATSAALSKAVVGMLAGVAHDGMARAIRPVHSMFDGDTIFGLATGTRQPPGRYGFSARVSSGTGALLIVIRDGPWTAPRTR